MVKYQAFSEPRPAALKARPYWRYMPSSSRERRVEHMAWYNLVLPADDPWWDAHYPPNGWGCKCGVQAISEKQLARLREKFKGTPYEVKTERPPEIYQVLRDKTTGLEMKVPKGIDPGWDYNPGRAFWGKKIAEQAYKEWEKDGKKWELLTPQGFLEAGHPHAQELPRYSYDTGKLNPIPRTLNQAQTQAKKLFGEATRFEWRPGEGVYVESKSLATHLFEKDPARMQFLPLIPDALEKPEEVWLSFWRHPLTGQVMVRRRIFKIYQPPKKGRYLLVMVQSRGGFPEEVTIVPSSDWNYLNNQRVGYLIWHRKEK